MEVGDTVFIYVSKPVAAIKYKCLVTKANLTEIEIDDSAFVIKGETYLNHPAHMELELIRTYNDELTMDILSQNGVKGRIMRPRRAVDEFDAYIQAHNL